MNGPTVDRVGGDWTAELWARDGLVAISPDGLRAIRESLTEFVGIEDPRRFSVVLGRGMRTPEQALENGTRLLAGLLGVDAVESEVDRVGTRVASEAASEEGESDAGLRHLPVLMRTKQRELTELRADAAEVGGDLEFANMQWLRERQDAETQLMAYRDRARELKARLQLLETGGAEADCPTCQRVLEERFEPVVAQIREEWEAVVQDGSWWKRRREQLELKPESLRELESNSIRLQAAIESCAEEIERLRARVRSETTPPVPSTEGHPRLRLLEALRTELVDEAEELLLGRAGRYLNRLTAGDVLALTLEDGEFRFVRDTESDEPTGDAERAALLFALRLALVDLCTRHGLRVDTLVLSGLIDRLTVESSVRAVVLLRALLGRIPRIVVECGPDIVKSAPEFFDWAVEVTTVAGGSRLRIESGGVGRLRVH